MGRKIALNSVGNHVGRNPPRLVAREQSGRSASARLILEIDIRELLPVVVAHHKTGV